MASEVFTSTGIWIAPSHVSGVKAMCWGGGAAGGGVLSPANYAGTGGGGGAFSERTFSVLPGSGYTVTVGSGGIGVLSARGGNGGDTWFYRSDSSGVLARGGNGGGSGNLVNAGGGGIGGSEFTGVGTVKWGGGNGWSPFNSGLDFGGGGGAAGGYYGHGGASPGQAGGTAPAGSGTVGADGGNASSNGNNGIARGAGGGAGGKIGTAGGHGGRGEVILFYDDVPPLSLEGAIEFVFDESGEVLLSHGVFVAKDLIFENSTSLNVQQGLTINPDFVFEISSELTQISPVRIEAGCDNVCELGVHITVPTRITSLMPLFLKTEELGTTSGSLPLFTFSTGNSGISNSLPLYLESASGAADHPSGTMPLFLCAPDSIGISGTMPLYLNSTHNSWAGSLDLYLCNEIVFSGIPLYTIGGVSDGSYSMAGAAISSGDMVLFINRPTSNILPLYLRGPGTLDSGVLDLYVAGASPASGLLPLAMPVTYDRKTSVITLYTHGW